MTDNLNESNPVNTDAKVDNVNASNTSHTSAWQLNALTAALGDLSLTVSDSLSVGRGSDNDVVLGSKAVSRNHAVLSVLNAELYVKDLDSSNGTFVNDERIKGNQSVLLKAEDKLGFASFEFQVVAPVNEQVATPAIDPVAKELEDKEPEDIVGTVQENLEADTSPAKEPAIEPSVPVAAVEKSIQETPSANVEAVSADTEAQPVVKETIIGEVLAASAGEQAMSAAPVEEDIVPVVDTETLPAAAIDKSATETVTENPVVAEPIADAPVFEEPVAEEPVAEEPVAEEPVAEEPVAEEPVAEKRVTEERIVEQPVVEEPTTETKLMAEKVDYREPVVSAEQDKTTTTALQEEADPDVLRAKQAATAQFSGTANLGQGRDLGTTGNNAMDQAINNPATTGQSEKKASGGWFIWVFIAILIIAIALWLFNMGGA